MCNDREKHGGSRRSFLRAAGLAGAGAAASAPLRVDEFMIAD